MENKFINGLIVKKPADNAPDFVKGKISIKREELIKTLQGMTGEWVNADILESKETKKWYAKVDDWKPEQKKSLSADEIDVSDIPF